MLASQRDAAAQIARTASDGCGWRSRPRWPGLDLGSAAGQSGRGGKRAAHSRCGPTARTAPPGYSWACGWTGRSWGRPKRTPGTGRRLEAGLRPPVASSAHRWSCAPGRPTGPGGCRGGPRCREALRRPPAGSLAADDPGGWVTVHLPAAGESDAQVRDPLRTTTVPVPLGGPSDVVPVASGPVSVLTAARSQEFTVETGQHVDLYF